jgi:hypothetical protein
MVPNVVIGSRGVISFGNKILGDLSLGIIKNLDSLVIHSWLSI